MTYFVSFVDENETLKRVRKIIIKVVVWKRNWLWLPWEVTLC